MCVQQLTTWRRAKIEIAVGKVVLRLEGDTASTRVAEIVSALERGV
jgi:transposase